MHMQGDQFNLLTIVNFSLTSEILVVSHTSDHLYILVIHVAWQF